MRVLNLSVLAATLVAVAATPDSADAQRRRSVRISFERERVSEREITLSVGALDNDHEDDVMPMAAVRVDWGLRRWLTSEVGASYAIGSIDRLENGDLVEDTDLQLATATVGVRAELPTPYLRPYVGAAAGLVFRNEEDGASYVRTTTAFPLGLRLNLSDRVSLRGEVRWRFDRIRGGGEVVRREQTGGLSVTF